MKVFNADDLRAWSDGNRRIKAKVDGAPLDRNLVDAAEHLCGRLKAVRDVEPSAGGPELPLFLPRSAGMIR